MEKLLAGVDIQESVESGCNVLVGDEGPDEGLDTNCLDGWL
jgi:hypothetical protein